MGLSPSWSLSSFGTWPRIRIDAASSAVPTLSVPSTQGEGSERGMPISLHVSAGEVGLEHSIVLVLVKFEVHFGRGG